MITSSESWTVPAGVNKITIVVVGGGGGGGGRSGGGGGGGGVVEVPAFDVTPGATYSITVGAGGGGGAGDGGTGGNGREQAGPGGIWRDSPKTGFQGTGVGGRLHLR